MEPFAKIHPQSRVKHTAEQLAALCMATEAGQFIGSEDDLMAQFGVSRPTLRQAARSVEGEQLLEVRRGAAGGFYAARPNVAHILQMLSRYLKLQGAELEDVARVSRLIGHDAVRLACANDNPALRERLQAFADGIDALDTPKAMILAETELAQLLAEMSGNPMIALVMAIGTSFGHADAQTPLFRSAEERELTRKLQRDLCQAVLARDADVAEIMMIRHGEQIGQWIRAHRIAAGQI
jgi:DNA-binding FadR family transcriptional regulator